MKSEVLKASAAYLIIFNANSKMFIAYVIQLSMQQVVVGNWMLSKELEEAIFISYFNVTSANPGEVNQGDWSPPKIEHLKFSRQLGFYYCFIFVIIILYSLILFYFLFLIIIQNSVFNPFNFNP